MSQSQDTQIFSQAVYEIANSVPYGRVASYGQIALLAGRPQCSRLVGRILSHAPAHMPCHRVVAHNGRLVPGWAEQRSMLLAEGVGFLPSGKVNMRVFRMRPAF